MENTAVILEMLKEYVSRIKRDVSDLISVSIVSTADGKVLVYDATNATIDNSKAGMYQVGVIRNATKAMEHIDSLKNKEINDITIGYKGQNHVLALSKSRKFLSHIIVKDSGNVVLLKHIMNKHIDDVTQELLNRGGTIQKVSITE